MNRVSAMVNCDAVSEPVMRCHRSSSDSGGMPPSLRRSGAVPRSSLTDGLVTAHVLVRARLRFPGSGSQKGTISRTLRLLAAGQVSAAQVFPGLRPEGPASGHG